MEFLGLEPTAQRHRWRLPVAPRICSGLGALFGGCGLGAAVEALEQVTGRPAVWATGQYLSYARPPSVLDVDVTEVVRGHHVSQARAVLHDHGKEILTVNAALGRRDLGLAGDWAEMPPRPAPADCPPRPLLPRHANTFADHVDARLAHARPPEDLPGPPGNGRTSLWLRLPDVDLSSALLAILGDFVPFGIGQALGVHGGGNSLDNTIRVAHREPAEWVLADIRIHAVVDGFAHGLVHLWGDHGGLLGTASQSAVVRVVEAR